DKVWPTITPAGATTAPSGATTEYRTYVHILYDPGKGKCGALLEVFVSGAKKLAGARDKSGSWQRILYELEPIDDFYLTKRAVYSHGVPVPMPTTTMELDCEFSAWSVNIPLTDSDFVISWKK